MKMVGLCALTEVLGYGDAALWEYQETEVEGVHLALVLAYHGLLCIPTRTETSMTPHT